MSEIFLIEVGRVSKQCLWPNNLHKFVNNIYLGQIDDQRHEFRVKLEQKEQKMKTKLEQEMKYQKQYLKELEEKNELVLILQKKMEEKKLNHNQKIIVQEAISETERIVYQNMYLTKTLNNIIKYIDVLEEGTEISTKAKRYIKSLVN